MISRKIYGPPGTGKTTKLINYVKTFYKLGTPLDKIGYFAFTTKAATEATNRMLDAYKHLQKKDLKYFKTLHSLAFNRLGMKKAQVMQDEHYEDIGRKLGIEVTVYSNGQENTGFVDSNSEYFNLINAARIKEISIEDEYNTGMYSYELEKNLLSQSSDAILGAGSIIDPATAAIFINLGAKFIVGPSTNSEVAKLCNRHKIPYIPGCSTATEISNAQELGVEFVKFFPGGASGGPNFVKDILGPMPQTSIIPTGGVDITEDSLKGWFNAGVSAVGIGSKLITTEIIKEKNWSLLEKNSNNVIKLVNQIRNK